MDIPEDDKYTSQTQAKPSILMNVYVLKRARAFQASLMVSCLYDLSLIHHGVTQSLKEF